MKAMLKKYTAKTQVCVNIVLPDSGKNLHVSFIPVTGGSGVFYTDDKNVQEGLERHYKYGKLFKLDEVMDETEAKATIIQDTTPEKPDEGLGKKPEVITVNCPDDAKDYLSDKFGLSRTRLRSIAAIKEAAAKCNIEFAGL